MSDKIVTSSIDEKEKKRRGGRGREGEEKEKARNRDALVSWMCARKRKKTCDFIFCAACSRINCEIDRNCVNDY